MSSAQTPGPHTEEQFAHWPLHDAVLKHVSVDWRERTCMLHLSVFIVQGEPAQACTATFSGVRAVSIPHRAAWGDSAEINSHQRLSSSSFQIEMQSGDLLEIEAEHAELRAASTERKEVYGDLIRASEAFLGALRPYSGDLPSAPFHLVMASLRSIAADVAQDELLRRDVASALWGMCDLTRRWALEPDSMLRRNSLLAEPDRVTLERWNSALSYAVMMLLDGQEAEVAFEEYDALTGRPG